MLKKLYGEIIIPEAVYKELSAKAESACKRMVDMSLDWIRVEKIQNQMAKSMYKTQLHEGEVEVMILSIEIGADVVIIDDANAKKHAKYLGLPVAGTLGILIKAKQEGHIETLRPILEQMIEHGIYGKLTAPLSIRNRRDIQVYLKRMKESESELIMNMTSKRHFHTVSAESEEILDEIEDALREKGILVRVAEVENND